MEKFYNKDGERITDSGHRILSFDKSGGSMEASQANYDEREALERLKTVKFNKVIQNIKEFGPLNKCTEEVIDGVDSQEDTSLPLKRYIESEKSELY